MATAITMEPAGDGARDAKSVSRRGSAGRKRPDAGGEPNEATRFFLGRGDGKTPGLDHEMPGEKEALLESLKTGRSYFAVTEWRAIADLSKQMPQIRKEAVRRDAAARSEPAVTSL